MACDPCSPSHPQIIPSESAVKRRLVIIILYIYESTKVLDKMQRAVTTMQMRAPGRSMVVRPQSARRSVVVRSAPKKEQIDQAVKEAEDACAGGDQGEWYVVCDWLGLIG